MLNIPTATLSVGIATLLVTGYIAWQQLQTARNKFRLDLFNRRFPVFEAAMKLVSIAVQKGDVSDEAQREFLIATKGVQFLFGQKLQDYCDTLAKEAVSLHVGYKLIDLPPGDEPAKNAEHKKRIEAWGEPACGAAQGDLTTSRWRFCARNTRSRVRPRTRTPRRPSEKKYAAATKNSSPILNRKKVPLPPFFNQSP